MSTPKELAGIIGYYLSQLRVQNRHHDFEHLCQDLARLRIASNILPATGPVAGSGDQGRDFETFYTYLRKNLRFSAGFIALASTDTVVFACTVQVKGVNAKIKSDVTAICTEGTAVDRVYFLASEPVKAGDRHDLAEWAEQEHKVKLTILDREAIAEMLCDRDVFWIAKTHLHLPAELAPDPPANEPAAPAWYIRLKARWSKTERAVENLGELMQAVDGLRHATDTRAVRGDLPDWLALFETYLSSAADPYGAQRARYEISRATLRGTGDLRPAEVHVEEFFTELPAMTRPVDLRDAGILITYLDAASRNGDSSIATAHVKDWAAQLRSHVDSLLAKAGTAGERAGLLDVAAHLALQIDADALAQADPEPENPQRPHRHRPPDELEDVVMPAWLPLVDADGAMALLLELIDLLPEAPLFPIGALSRHLDMLAPVLVEHPHYRQVRSALDEAVGQQAGAAASARSCRTRAMALYSNGKLLAALRELHEAKVSWWHGDTVRSSILAMLFISHIYRELHLPQVAKKYALAAAFAALNTDDARVRDLAPIGLFRAAHAEYEAGAWLAALELTGVGTALQSEFAPDPWNLEMHEDFERAAAYAASIKAAVRHRPELAAPVDRLVGQAGLTELVEEILAEEPEEFASTEDALAERSEKTLNGAPFGDAAPVRTICFGALGQRWRVHCANERDAVAAAEEFCAIAQIVLAEFAAGDPMLLTATVEIEIEFYSTGQTPAEHAVQVPDNSCVRWKVHLPEPADQAGGQSEMDVLATLAVVLSDSSLLPWEAFEQIIDAAGREGLRGKLSVVARYQRTAAYFTWEVAELEGPVRAQPIGNPARFPASEALELAAKAGDGPGYERDKALEAVALRYENCAPMMRHSLPRLLADPDLKALLTRAVEDGRPEWIVMMALANIVMNHRITAQFGPLTDPAAARRLTVDQMRRQEHADDPSPSPAQVAAVFALQLGIVTVTVAQFWGLTVHQRTPDLDAIESVLKSRYHFWDDDVEHTSFLRD